MLDYSQECQLLLFLDTDAIFTNFSMKVKLCLTFFKQRINKCSLTYHLLTDTSMLEQSLCVTLMMLIHSILLAAMDEQQWYKNWRTTWEFEQSAMWELIRPPNSRWRSIIHILEDDHTLQGLCGFSKCRCLWKPGDFIIHFVPPPNKAKEI